MNKLIQFLKDNSGAELAEYAVAIALLVAIASVVFSIIGQAIADENAGTGADIKGVPRSFPF